MAKQSPYETYGDYQRRVYCENASLLGYGIGLNQQCLDGKKEFVCVIKYNDVEEETLKLCESCRNNLERDAKRYKYSFRSRKLS